MDKELRLKIAIGLALIFVVVECIGGYLANSLAISTDAAHLLSDVAGFVIALVALISSRTPGSKNFTYGFRRMELFGAIASIFFLWVVTLWLVVEAFYRALDWFEGKSEPIDGKLMFFLALFGVFVNILLAFVFHEEHGSGLHDHGHDHGHNHDHGHSNNSDTRRSHFISIQDRSHSHSHGHDHSHGQNISGVEKEIDTASNDREGWKVFDTANHFHGHEHEIKESTSSSEHQFDIDGTCNEDLTHPGVHCGDKVASISTQISLPREQSDIHEPLERHSYAETGFFHSMYSSIFSGFASVEITDTTSLTRGTAPLQTYGDDAPVHSIQASTIQEHSDDHAASHHGHVRDANFEAAYLHVLMDLIQSIGVALAGLILWMVPGAQLVDPLCTVLFSTLVIWSTVPLVSRVFVVFMEGKPDHVDWDALEHSLYELEGVYDVHDLHVWSLSSSHTALTVHMQARNPQRVLLLAHTVCRQYGITHATIQVHDSTSPYCDEEGGGSEGVESGGGVEASRVGGQRQAAPHHQWCPSDCMVNVYNARAATGHSHREYSCVAQSVPGF